MKKLNVKNTFLIVYGCISVATFYHTTWGFATLQGVQPTEGISLFFWWFIGGLSAFAIDVGMAAIVYALISSWDAKWLYGTLCILALASAYTQLIYAAHHAAQYTLGVVPNWLNGLGVVLDLRTVILPILLPTFAVAYAFAAKVKEPAESLDNNDIIKDTPTIDPNLTTTQLKVLEFISKQGTATRKDIYTEFAKSPSFASAHVKPLIELGLIAEADGTLTTNGVFHNAN